MKWLLWLAVLCVLAPGIAWGQNAQRIPTCGTGQPPSGMSPPYMDSNGNWCVGGTVYSAPSLTSYQGTMTLSAATSTSLIAANVTMNNSTVLPLAGAFGNVSIVNNGTNSLIVCWFGGTCSAAAGGETLLAGAGDNKNLTGAANAPTLYSASGTTLSFSN